MNYKMKVKIENPKTEKGMCGKLYLELQCSFSYDENQYGNGHYLDIKMPEGYKNSYDIRYDKTFNRKNKISYLTKWAENYWSGENGEYKLKSITIIEE